MDIFYFYTLATFVASWIFPALVFAVLLGVLYTGREKVVILGCFLILVGLFLAEFRLRKEIEILPGDLPLWSSLPRKIYLASLLVIAVVFWWQNRHRR